MKNLDSLDTLKRSERCDDVNGVNENSRAVKARTQQ